MPPKNKKKGLKKKKQGGNGPGRQVRSLLTTTLPKSSLSISSYQSRPGASGTVFRVTGCEVVAKITTSLGYFAQFNTVVNPANSMSFPRLSALALVFERYRFTRLTAVYHTACPATRSGSIGLLIDYDVDDFMPASMVELAENESGAVGTVAANLLVDGKWPKDGTWFLCTPTDSQSDETEWRHAGRFRVLTQDSIAADGGLLAGYVSLHYEVEFLRPKPLRPIAFEAELRADTTISGATPTVISMNARKSVGWFDWLNQAAAVDPLYPTLPYYSQVSIPSSTTMVSTIGYDVGAPSLDGCDEVKTPRAAMSGLQRDLPTGWSWLNPAFSPSKHERETLGSDPRHCVVPVMPHAANDHTVNLVATLLGSAVATVVYTHTYNSAFALQVRDVVRFVVVSSARLYWSIINTGAEGRVIESDGSFVSHVTVTEVD